MYQNDQKKKKKNNSIVGLSFEAEVEFQVQVCIDIKTKDISIMYFIVSWYCLPTQ